MLLDIGSGILTAIFVSWFFGMPVGGLLAISIAFALLPDADFIFHTFKRRRHKEHSHRHRELLHYPIPFIAVGTIIASWFGVEYGILFAIASSAHFMHDSIGIGWGVQWLYPFGKKHYGFIYRYQAPGREKVKQRILHVWPHEEIDLLVEKHGDPDWIKNIYLRFHPYAIFELIIFLISLIALYRYAHRL